MNLTHYAMHVELKRDSISNFNEYPFSLPAVKNLERLEFHPKVTFLVGENGSGKSTLLEAIAVQLGFNPEGGSKNFRFETRGSHSSLHQHLRIAKGLRRPKDGFFLRAESFFNLATEMERLDAEPSTARPLVKSYGGISLHEQSHGESFMALMLHHFSGHGLYILDEPEAALSPHRQLAAMVRMHDLIAQESQFIIATHSPILMGYPDAYIYVCTPNGLQRVPYEETDHYRITREFLQNPRRMLNILLAPEKT